ncbi:2'-deoxycytidine 5'-triphosphate deaminase [Patescibacteria group bacterium]|nr:MAG: 2'-deoxycytidine 5'-triphosphate deaminase [Patescibacteria group bacterium]
MASRSAALAAQHIRSLLRHGAVREADESSLQPSSLDLSVSGELYRMRGSFLPQPGEKIRDILKRGILFPAPLNQPLELNGIYWIRLNELLDLPPGVFATTNNKSSSGRINLQTRLVANGVSAFDYVPRGYRGELWLEVVPKSFPVKLSYGERLNQMRFYTGNARLPDDELRREYARYGFLRDAKGEHVPLRKLAHQPGITMTIDLASHDVVGYRCGPTMGRLLDFTRRDHDPSDFFEPIPRPADGQFVMRRGEFYVFATKEGIRVPLEFAAEMVPYDVTMGEFRSHYAGFFDPGFGYGAHGETLGTPAVLEVFTHDRDFVLRDGQPVCQMTFERLSGASEISYGDPSLVSNYYKQTGPRLSKHFKMK